MNSCEVWEKKKKLPWSFIIFPSAAVAVSNSLLFFLLYTQFGYIIFLLEFFFSSSVVVGLNVCVFFNSSPFCCLWIALNCTSKSICRTFLHTGKKYQQRIWKSNKKTKNNNNTTYLFNKRKTEIHQQDTTQNKNRIFHFGGRNIA